MKKSILISLLLTHFCLLADAQWNLYVVGGISPANHPGNADLMVNRDNPMETFFFNMSESRSQYFIGLNARRPLNDQFFAEIGSVYTKSTCQYKMEYLVPKGLDTYHEMKECAQQIQIPFGIGAKLNAFEVTTGFQATWTLSHQCGLSAIEGFNEQANPLHFGWHSGLQLHFGRMLAGIEYQAQFKRVGSDMDVKGQSLELMNVPSRFFLKAQYALCDCKR